MGDGSNLGVDADRALKTILGEEPQPAEEERQSKPRVLARILKAYINWDGEHWPGYGDAADIMAGAVFDFFIIHPEAMDWPIEQEYKRDPETGRYTDPMEPIGLNLYNEVKANTKPAVRKVLEECSGFQWGWAANTARWVLDLPEQANPAILTIGGSDD